MTASVFGQPERYIRGSARAAGWFRQWGGIGQREGKGFRRQMQHELQGSRRAKAVGALGLWER